jgi:uncharacterized protein (TIGR02270 family)
MRENLLPRWDIYEEHLDEASFLWMRWERCLLAPDYSLPETAEWDARLLAHLEALTSAHAIIAERLLWPALESDELERQCAAAYTLLAGGADLERMLRLVEDDVPGMAAALQRALGLVDWPGRSGRLRALVSASHPTVKALALEALTFRAEGPAEDLGTLLQHESSEVRVAALRCARFSSEQSALGALRDALTSRDTAVRMAAIEVGLLRGWRSAWEACRELARTSEAPAQAWVLLALGGGGEELRWLVERLGEARRQAQALWALGFSGRPDAAEACLGQLREKPDLSALAAEAFSAITGLPIHGRYAAPRQEEELEDDPDADLTPKPEDDLPLPQPEAIAGWWQEARAKFERSQRYLYGRACEGAVLLDALVRAPMRRRHVLALELALRGRGTPWLQTRAFTPEQHAGLRRLHGAPPFVSQLPFARSHTR